METYVVLFRGVNVGGKNLLHMKELVAALEEYGYQNVKTYIQSGNVVLKGKQCSSSGIAKLVFDEFGFDTEVLILKKSEFLSSIMHNPFHPKDGKCAHFYFCSKKPRVSSGSLEKYLAENEEV